MAIELGPNYSKMAAEWMENLDQLTTDLESGISKEEYEKRKRKLVSLGVSAEDYVDMGLGVGDIIFQGGQYISTTE